MKFIRTKIPDVVICEPTIHGDSRGYFFESFRQDKLNDFLGMNIEFVQDNESRSAKGVLRGLHYQLAPFAQTKLVRVFDGEVLDVAVDIRKGSPSFGEHVAVKLSADNKRQLLIPRGFAHGFVVLSDIATFAYKVDAYYSPKHDRGIAFDDTDLAIDWELDKRLLKLSNKDLNHAKFNQVNEFFEGDALYD